MTKVLNLVYVMIIFIFLFFVVANTESKSFIILFFSFEANFNPYSITYFFFIVYHSICFMFL